MTNSTESASVDFHFVFTMITLSLCIGTAFFGNLIVLFVFAYVKELQTLMNYFLVSLSLADLLTAMFPIPVWLAVKVHHDRWPFSVAFLKAWRAMDLLFCTSSIWNLCAISIDRCLAIGWPFLHRVLLTPFRMKCAVAAVWIYSTVISVLITDSVKWSRRGFLISCLAFYIPTLIIITAYLTIFVTEFKARMELREVADTPLRQRCKQDLKMAKYMIILIASFIFCWAGHFIVSTRLAFGGSIPDQFLIDLIKAMSYINSAINPFLYGYVSPKFRAAVMGVLRCRGRNVRLVFGGLSPTRTPSQRTSTTKLDERPPRICRETGV